MQRSGPQRPSAATVVLCVFTEVLFLPVMLLAAPIGALDERYGWTAKGRRARALQALREGPIVSIERGVTLPRAIVEGALEPAGPCVRVPFVDVEAIAWSVWAQDGSLVEWIDGDSVPFNLVDERSAARVELGHRRDLGWTLGERRVIHEISDEWRRKTRRDPDSWEISWITSGSRVRASGRVTRIAPDTPFRGSTISYALGPDSEGTPVQLTGATTARRTS